MFTGLKRAIFVIVASVSVLPWGVMQLVQQGRSSARSTSPSVPINWLISVFEMIRGGLIAMMSPAVRIRMPFSRALRKALKERYVGLPGMPSSSTAPISPMLRMSMTWGWSHIEWIASCQ
jgi:hypothetical protein